MKKLVVFILVIMLSSLSFAQFKNQAKLPPLSKAIAKPTTNFIFGFLNPDKMTMQHSFSMSFMTMGKHNMMLNTYMNTINYRISDPLLLRLNLGIANSPYNTFDNSALSNTKFFGGAELFYRPTENTLIKLGLDVRPGYYYPGNYYDYTPGFFDSYFELNPFRVERIDR